MAWDNHSAAAAADNDDNNHGDDSFQTQFSALNSIQWKRKTK